MNAILYLFRNNLHADFLRQQTYCVGIDFLHIFSYQYKTNEHTSFLTISYSYLKFTYCLSTKENPVSFIKVHLPEKYKTGFH